MLSEMTDNLTPWTRTGGDNSFDVVAMERWMNTVLASRVDHVQVSPCRPPPSLLLLRLTVQACPLSPCVLAPRCELQHAGRVRWRVGYAACPLECGSAGLLCRA